MHHTQTPSNVIDPLPSFPVLWQVIPGLVSLLPRDNRVWAADHSLDGAAGLLNVESLAEAIPRDRGGGRLGRGIGFGFALGELFCDGGLEIMLVSVLS